MATSLDDLRDPELEYINSHQNIPQSTLQRAPPMRYGMVENYPTHQTVYNPPTNYPGVQRNYPMKYSLEPSQEISRTEKTGKVAEGVLSGLMNRLKDPVIIIILFILLAHRNVVRIINPFLPFTGETGSVDLLSLVYRGFILSLLYLIIRRKL